MEATVSQICSLNRTQRLHVYSFSQDRMVSNRITSNSSMVIVLFIGSSTKCKHPTNAPKIYPGHLL